MQLSIVRHGMTAANATGLLQGRTDNPLNSTGEQQAEQIAVALRAAATPVDRIVSSPLARAINTAAPLAHANNLAIETDERWIELDYGAWEQKPAREITAQEWERWRSDPGFTTPPGDTPGESLLALQTRVWASCVELAEGGASASQHVAVFTHVSPIKAAVGWALGIDPQSSAAMSWRLHVAQAQISVVNITGSSTPGPNPTGQKFAIPQPGQPRLLAFNSTSHLG